jgi:uncharacterized protein
MNTMNTKGCALVTGSSQGLGKAIAEELAGRGMNLVLVALPRTGLPEVAEVIRLSYGIEVTPWEADLTDGDGLRTLVDWINSENLPISLLVNNAGTGYNSLFRESSLEQNDATIELNVLALVRLTHLLLPRLVSRHGAHILNVASLAAYFPMPYMPVYSPSKTFVVNFSLALREELRETGVNVSVLCPNGIRTNSSCRLRIDAQGFAGRITCSYPDEVARYAVGKLLHGRAVIVPGWVNRVLQVVGRLVPRSLVFRVVSHHWGSASGYKETESLFGEGPATSTVESRL